MVGCRAPVEFDAVEKGNRGEMESAMRKKNVFHRALDVLVESRTRQAARFLEAYAKSHPSNEPRQG